MSELTFEQALTEFTEIMEKSFAWVKTSPCNFDDCFEIVEGV